MFFSGRRILLGITGGIAAYKCAELVRLLRKQDAEVQVVMTPAATEFITPLTLQALSGRPVRVELFDEQQEAAMGHIDLARWADLVLIAPASANFMSDLAYGRADNLLSTLCLAAEVPLVVAPAMNQAMWANPATVRNVDLLKQSGIKIWGPAEGDQACGETGAGRLLEPMDLLGRIRSLLTSGPMQGVRVLLTAGPTREPVDPVRYLGNRSSGKMGFALAQALVQAGASVTLVCGPVSLPAPAGVKRIDVETALEMRQAVFDHVQDCDLFVAAAAVADYRVDSVKDHKIKKNGRDISLHLKPNPDILAEVAALGDAAPFTLGFAAETENLEQYAQEKRRRKGIDMIAANLVGQARGGFEDNNNALTLFWQDGQKHLPMMDKKELARQLVQLLAEKYHAQIAAESP